MFIYLFLFFIILISMRYEKQNKINCADIIILVLMITISGFRDRIGTDYNMYKSFYFYPTQSTAQKVEYGFIKLINISQNLFGDKYYLFFFFCSIITIVPIYWIFKKKSNHPIFSILLFVCLGFYTLTFNMIRQCIAMAIVFYALRYIEERRLVKYCIAIAIAYLFHITSLIVLPMYFFANLNINKKHLKKFFFILLFTGALFNPIFNYIVNNIPQYEMYKIYDNIDAGIGTYLVNSIYLLMIWFVLSKKEFMVKNKFQEICLNISIISVPMIIFSFKNVLFARMIYYFFIPLLIPFANILDFFRIKNTQYIFNIVFCILLLIIFILNIILFNGVYPYQSVKIV